MGFLRRKALRPDQIEAGLIRFRDRLKHLQINISALQIKIGFGHQRHPLPPWNIYLFLVGLIGWFIVGVLWKDRAIMLIHIVALGAMITGMMGQ